MGNELISIIIPCYNAEAYIGTAIESALRQDYTPTEVIVINDGSTDDSLKEIKSFGEVRWRSTPNQGATAARNEGLRMAEGEFVKFLDADDVLASGTIDRQVDQIRSKCRPCQIPFGEVSRMSEDGEAITERPYPRFEAGKEASILDLIKENIQTSAPLHRKSHLQEIGGFDEELPKRHEYDLHLRLHAAGTRFRFFEGICCYCRAHEDGGRLSNWDPISDHPDSVRRMIHRQIAAVRNAHGRGLPEEARVYFAQSLWAGGRRALRAGHEEEAHRYFEDARNLHSEKHMKGSVLYRTAVHVFGPQLPEQVKEFVRPY